MSPKPSDALNHNLKIIIVTIGYSSGVGQMELLAIIKQNCFDKTKQPNMKYLSIL